MKRSTRWTSGVAALGAAALGVGLLGYGSGVGAAFTDAVHGNANIAVGTLSCGISSTDTAVTVAGKTATVDLGTINSSDAGSQTAPLTVTNTGSTPMMVTWTEATGGSVANAPDIHPAATPVSAVLSPNSTQTVNIGFTWSELQNADEGRSGAASYTASCNSNLNVNSGFSLFGQDGGTATWDGTAQSVGLTVDPSQSGSAAGINISNVPTTLPGTAPAFTTDSYGVGTPRFDIEFSNGKYAFGYPAQGTTPATWSLPGSGAAVGWSAVQGYATTNSLTVKQAFVVMDTSNTASSHANISCVDYSGTPVIGTGC